MGIKNIVKKILPTNLEEKFIEYREKLISYEEFLGILSKNKKKINKQYHHKRTILIWASYVKDIPLCSDLLNMGADPNICDYKNRSPLHWAVHWGDLELVKLIVSNGGNINIQDINERSPLDYAQFHQHYDIFKYFIELQEKSV